MNYHLVIQEERRKSTEDEPRELAIPISTSDEGGVLVSKQLHIITNTLPQDSEQILYSATEDGTIIKNEIGELNMKYAGWSN